MEDKKMLRIPKTIKTKIPFVARETFYYIGYQWYQLFGQL